MSPNWRVGSSCAGSQPLRALRSVPDRGVLPLQRGLLPSAPAAPQGHFSVSLNCSLSTVLCVHTVQCRSMNNAVYRPWYRRFRRVSCARSASCGGSRVAGHVAAKAVKAREKAL